jgi:hypothetical protein
MSKTFNILLIYKITEHSTFTISYMYVRIDPLSSLLCMQDGMTNSAYN